MRNILTFLGIPPRVAGEVSVGRSAPLSGTSSGWTPEIERAGQPGRTAHRAREAGRRVLAFGYRPANPVTHRAWNVLLALTLLLSALPAMAIIAAAVLVASGRPILYRGERLGLHRQTFHIYKFRSLVADAEKRLAGSVLPADSGLVTRIGKFLRATRLDELPQLFNILRGDMNVFGPRPVRAAVAELQGRGIAGYERRFAVRPGLLGHTQVFMPHGTSKTIRARYNHILLARKTNARRELAFVIVAALFCLGHCMQITAEAVTSRFKPRSEGDAAAKRIRGLEIELGQGRFAPAQVRSITSGGMLISCKAPLPQGDHPATLVLRKASRGQARVRLRLSSPVPVAEGPGGNLLRVSYLPESEFGRYLIDRHVLRLIFGLG